MKEKILNLLNKIPEFSKQSFFLASKICAGLLLAAAIFFIYEMFTVNNFGIDVNWNYFTSAWFWPLFVIGFILALANWGKFGHWGGQPYDIYEDPDGKKIPVRNDDITDNMLWQIVMPLLGHFIIEPIIYGCLIYYPLMCVFAIVGLILPYLLALILLAIPVCLYIFAEAAEELRYRSILLVLVTLILTVGLTWISINMENGKPENKVKNAIEQVEDAANDLCTKITE